MTIENESKRASRRRFMTAAGVASLTFAAPAIVRAQGKKPIKVSVGRQPWAAGNSPVTQYMVANKTFERFAADAGYDLTVDYRDYPSALPMVEAFVSGNLDFGMWGNTPCRHHELVRLHRKSLQGPRRRRRGNSVAVGEEIAV